MAWGATRYEFRMQVRRKALWVGFLVFGLAFPLLAYTPWSSYSAGFSVPTLVANWSLALQIYYPIVFGLLLADRLPRDGRLGVEEVFDTVPTAAGARFLGKYLGATAATLLPLAVIYAGGVGSIVVDRGALAAVPLGIAAFVAINVPGLLFVAAFSVAGPAVLWVPLYQFLFVGYWFWGNLIPTDAAGETIMPSLSHTLLTPLGEYMASGFFGTEQTTARATVMDGVASLLLLLGCGVVALVAGYRCLEWQRERRFGGG